MKHLINNKSTADMICLDFQRRLTRWTMVSSCIKQDYGITGRLILWLFHILTKMQHYIRKPVLSAPRFCPRPLTIFILFIDTDKGISPSSKLVSFAYDTRVYVCINDIDKCNQLQIDLNSVYDSVHCKQQLNFWTLKTMSRNLIMYHLMVL